ncbi:MAG: cohesin domain-containing protein [Saprospiraceae bacterium]
MNQKNLFTNLLSLLLFCFGFNQTLSAENTADANCLLTLDIADHVITASGDEVCLSVTTQNFTDIVSMQFDIEFNTGELEFTTVNSGSIDIPDFAYNVFSPGQLRIAFVNPDILTGITLADGTVAFDICFNVLAASGTVSPVQFMGSSTVEFVAIPTTLVPSTLLGGSVQVDGTAPASPLQVTEECGLACAGLDIIVDGGQAPYSYQWTGPNNYSSTSEDLTGVESGTYTLIVTDNTGTTMSSAFSVDEFTGLSTSSEVTPVDCSGSDNGAIDLTVNNGTAPYSFVWSNGAATEDLTNLPAGVYSITVTDASGCFTTEEITVTGSSLNALESASVGDAYCGSADGSITLEVAGGIPMNYNFLWSNGETVMNLTNLAAGEYTVTITEASGGSCATVETFEVQDLGITFALSYECNTIEETGTITAFVFDSQENYNFEWSNGVTDTDDETSEIADLDSGTYSVTVTGLTSGCTETLSITIDCTNGPVSDCFSLAIGNNYSEAGEQICVPIKTNGFDEIEGIQFSLEWDATILNYENTEAYGLPGMVASNFGESLVAEGKLAFLWYNSNPANGGETLSDGTTLFEICFDVIGATGTSSVLNITGDPAAMEVLTGGPSVSEIGFSGSNGQVHIGTNTDSLIVHDICATGDLCSSEVTLNGSASGGYAPYTYVWTDGVGTGIGTTPELTVDTEGYFEILVTDANGNTATAFTNVIDQDCVWPGDTDDDGEVTNFDLLNIGLGAGTTGPVRPNASIAWLGQPAPNWFQSTPVTEVNYKHIDTDGSGDINANDTTAIIQNWGEVHSFTGNDDESQFNDDIGSDGGPASFLTVPFYVQPDTIEPNIEVALPVILGDTDNTVSDLYGIAFTITYDPEIVVVNSARAAFGDSWLGDINDNTIAIQKAFHSDGRLDIAITRMDGNNMDGFGKLADFYITIEDDIFLNGGGDNSRGVLSTDTDFGIENVRMITNEEVELLVVPMTTTSVVQTISTSTDDWDGVEAIRVFPNPVFDQLTIQSPNALIQSVEVYNVVGALLETNDYASNNKAVLNTNNLSEGTYFLKVQTEKGQTTRRIVVLKK